MSEELRREGAPMGGGIGAVIWGFMAVVVGVLFGMLFFGIVCSKPAPALTLTAAETSEPIILIALWNASEDPQPSSGCCNYLLEVHENNIESLSFTLNVADTTAKFEWTPGAWAYVRVMAIDFAGLVSEWSDWAVWCPYDLNNDGVVDIDDRRALRKLYGHHPGSPKWDVVCDYNGDGIIDIDDGRLLKKQEGRLIQ